MADKPKKIRDTDIVLFLNGVVVATKAVRRATGFSGESNQGWQHHEEIGNKNIVHTSYDVPESTVSLDFDLSDNTISLLQNLFYLASGEVDEDDFYKGTAYIMVRVSEDGGTSISRTDFYPACYANSIDINTAVNSNATLRLNFEGSEIRSFLNDYRIAKMEVLANASFSTNTTWDATTLSGGSNTELYLFVDGELFEVTAATESGKFKWDDATDVVTLYGKDVSGCDHAVLICYETTPATTFANITAAPTAVMGLKHDQVKAFIGDGSVPSDMTERLQSIGISIPLTRTKHDQIGTSGPYDRSLDEPIEITHTLDVNQSDLDFYAALAGQTFATVDELKPSQFEANQDVAARYSFYSDKSFATEILRMSFTSLRANGPGLNATVGGIATERWTLVGDNITISGIVYA